MSLDPKAPGGPYGTGSPYCGSCYPYGPGFPDDPNAPTSSECISDPRDPCAEKELQKQPCHTSICDPRFVDLPPSHRVILFGANGKCLHRFPDCAEGLVASDKKGQFVTNRPRVNLPFKKEFQRDPETGEFLVDENGAFLEAPVPKFPAILISDECGAWNRVQGLPGIRQRIVWDGENHCYIEDPDPNENPLLDPKDVPQVDTVCPAVLHAVLVPTKEIVIVNGKQETVFGFKIGSTTVPAVPIGATQIWPGSSTNIPVGWALCDGSLLLKADFPDLFTAIGDAWGESGDFFNLPDFRGLFLRGVDIDADRDPDKDSRVEIAPNGNTGNAVGSLQEDQMQCFDAEYDRYFHRAESVTQATAGSSKNVARDSDQYDATEIEFIDGGCGDPRFGDETRPKNAYVNYIINTGCPPDC